MAHFRNPGGDELMAVTHDLTRAMLFDPDTDQRIAKLNSFSGWWSLYEKAELEGETVGLLIGVATHILAALQWVRGEDAKGVDGIFFAPEVETRIQEVSPWVNGADASYEARMARDAELHKSYDAKGLS